MLLMIPLFYKILIRIIIAKGGGAIERTKNWREDHRVQTSAGHYAG